MTDDVEKHANSLQNLVQCEVYMHELMKNHTTYHIGGPADIFMLPNDVEDIQRIISYARSNEIQYYIVGNGSNLLVSDAGIRGIVVKIGSRMSNVQLWDSSIRVQAGLSLPVLSKMALEHELSGLEYAVGIPGTVGGAVVMNAGSNKQYTSQIVTSTRVMNIDGEIMTLRNENLGFGHRESRFRHSKEIVLDVELQLQYSEKAVIKGKMEGIIEKRRKSMPLSYPSCGSVFKNPEGDYAGRLIEQAGCKGLRVGNAQVSDIHANWIINLGKAKASDVLALIERIQKRVQLEFGLILCPEVIVL